LSGRKAQNTALDVAGISKQTPKDQKMHCCC